MTESKFDDVRVAWNVCLRPWSFCSCEAVIPGHKQVCLLFDWKANDVTLINMYRQQSPSIYVLFFARLCCNAEDRYRSLKVGPIPDWSICPCILFICFHMWPKINRIAEETESETAQKETGNGAP
jgi:hypothetical protein